uniref:SLC51 subunit beta n=1 Tax=Bos taurus TaxID=9913 RepID=A0AAA9TY31_BOVIN
MNYSEKLTGAPPMTEVPLELLEEMLWFFRVEDATPWNCSMFVLAALVAIISFILLGRNIQANSSHDLKPEKESSGRACKEDLTVTDNCSPHPQISPVPLAHMWGALGPHLSLGGPWAPR